MFDPKIKPLNSGPPIVIRQTPGSGEQSPRALSALDDPTKDLAGDYRFNPTDVGNAESFASRHGLNIRYCPKTASWYHWNGKLWLPDATREVYAKAKDTIKALFDGLKEVTDVHESCERRSWLVQSEKAARINAMVELASCDRSLIIDLAELDSHHRLLNTPNGVVDLATGTLLPHRRELFLTKCTLAEYCADIRSDWWEAFVLQLCGGDRDVAEFLQLATGYSIQGSTKEERIFLIHGPGGTGKSTYMDALARALGDYYKAANATTFLKRDRASSGPSEEIARLAGARLVSAIEVDDGQKLAEGLVKQISGGDMIAARSLYKESFQFRPNLKLWFVVNHVPAILSDDDAMWRRMLRLPFTNKPAQVDRGLKDRLSDPEISKAILAWAVAGCVRWHREGLKVPDAIRKSTEHLREEMNPLTDYIADNCQVGEEYVSVVTELRHNYEEWCKGTGQRFPLSRQAFNRNLEALGFRHELMYIEHRRTRCWRGFALKQRTRTIPGYETPSVFASAPLTRER